MMMMMMMMRVVLGIGLNWRGSSILCLCLEFVVIVQDAVMRVAVVAGNVRWAKTVLRA